ncbi:lipopolysaccharide biosynthesis protein [Actinomycetospora sp. CA-101289]|uniref:lipopolysaccharide biosynthesis protein n=1 Tax=Actinomycetospora sp. CA-101289 TaxID=3239893 RepID=UPI003D95145E
MTELATVGAALLVFHLVARLGVAPFAEYQVARAAITSLGPALVVGLAVALPKYVSRAVARDGGRAPDLLRTALLLGAGSILCVAVAGTWFSGAVAQVVFGSADRSDLVVGIVVMACGVVADGVTYGYVRGRLLDQTANLVRILNLGVSPLAAALLADDVVSLLVLAGSFMVLGSLVTLAVVAFRPRLPRVTAGTSGAMVRYALRRMPGDIALAALLTLPTILATHLVGIEEAGYVGFGTSVVALVVAFMAPVSYVLVPRLSHDLVRGGGQLLETARWLPVFFAALAVCGVVALYFLMPLVVSRYLGPEFSGAVVVAREVMLSSIPLAVFMGGRSLIDALYESARNSRNLIIAVLVEIAATFAAVTVWSGATGVAVGLFCGCSALAVLTGVAQWRIPRIETGRV